MKTLLSLISILAIISTGYAQDANVLKAKALLDKVSEKTKTYSTIRANFSITVEKIQTNNATDNYVGKITMKGNKYKVEVMDTETYFDGATLWTYLPDANEVSISDVSMLENSLLDPTTIFTIHEKGYKYIYAGETTINNKKVDIIDLFPEKRDQPFSRIKVYVYKDNLQFARLAQIGRDGTNYIIDIKKLEINIPTDDAIFIFDTKRYSGIEVIDMR